MAGEPSLAASLEHYAEQLECGSVSDPKDWAQMIRDIRWAARRLIALGDSPAPAKSSRRRRPQ